MRWRELLECVEAEPGITPDAIAARMGVSTRSIRSFAREANERLGRAASLAKRRGGVSMVLSTMAAFVFQHSPSGRRAPLVR